MAKKQRSLNDLSQLGSLLGMSTPSSKQEQKVIDMKEYQKIWADKYPNDAFDIKKAEYRPSYDNELMSELSSRDFRVDNFALKLNKFPRYERDEKGQKKFRFFGKFKPDRQEAEFSYDTKEFKYEIKEFYGIDSRIFKSIANREKQNAEIITNKNLKEAKFQPDWRLVIGLGGASVYETGMTLHHIYGFPYIPASAIKGVLRNYIIQTVFLPEFESQENAGEKAEKKALKHLDFLKIFGSTDQQGKAIFFDAFPTEIPQLKPDIMNVHYKDWYGNKKDKFNNPIPPTDTQQPNPIPFLTVEKTSFQFIVGTKESNALIFDGKSIMDLLKTALTEHGIGAKTAVGYGYMKEQ